VNNKAAPWEEVTLEAFGEIVAGGTPSRTNSSYWGGSIPWVTPGEIKSLNSKYLRDTREKITQEGLAASAAKLLPVGSLLVTTRATLGEVAIAAVPVATNQGFKSIIPNENADSVFAYYRVGSLKQEMTRLASGTTFLEISKADFSRIETPRPQREEQSRIAAVLDTVDEAIAKTEAVIAKLKQMRAGLLHDLLTRGLDEHGQLRDPVAHPERFQDSPLGPIPKEWEVVRVGNETDIEHGFAFDGGMFTDKPVGPTLLVPGNFHRDGGLYFTDENTKHFAGEFPSETVLGNGEVLIVMTDLSPRTLILGRTVLLNEPFLVLHNQRIGKFRFKQPTEWNREFFVALMNDERVRRNVIREATGTTVRHTSPDRVKNGLGVKPRREEQDQIVSTIHAFDSEIAATTTELTKLTAIKSGLMNDLLTGRVRVPENILDGVELR
jgi:type I restriction enzyme S subunit